jgi:hypothetical protein
MTDLHDQFDVWLQRGAGATLGRDVAVHASGCDICLRLAAAFDALLEIDLDGVPLPAIEVSVTPARTSIPVRVGRFALGAAVASVLIVLAFNRFGAPLEPAANQRGPTTGSAPPREGTLGRAEDPSRSADASPDGTEGSTPSSSAAPTSTADRTPSPTFGGGTPPIVFNRPTPTAAPATPLPTPTATVVVTPSVTATATPSPTATATPTASPTPTPTPSPSESPVP